MKQKKEKSQSASDLKSEQQKFIAVLNYLKLFQPEGKYKVICPFHGDVNASLLIDIEDARFHCFGCGRSGGAFKFLAYYYPEKKPMDILLLLKQIINDKGLTVSDIRITPSESKKNNINAAKDYYYNLPKIDWSDVGYEDEQTKTYLRKRGFTSHILNQAKARVNVNVKYPIIFPIMDNGVFRGYVCRTTSKDVEAQRKYLYNTGFRRAKTLAGNYGESDTVLVVEGFMDMLKAMQMGVSSVVAILGWKISEKQVWKLQHRGVKRIICGLDNDECGRKGYKYLKSLGMFEVIRMHYPKGIKDFGDVNKKIFNERIKTQLIKYGLINVA
jgi:DNA primase